MTTVRIVAVLLYTFVAGIFFSDVLREGSIKWLFASFLLVAMAGMHLAVLLRDFPKKGKQIFDFENNEQQN